MAHAYFGRMIDVHTHAIPDHFPDNPSPASNTRWPCLAVKPQSASLMIDNKPFRDIDARSWDVSRRLEDMDRDGVAIHVLSPLPELLSYWFEPNDAVVMCDHVNGTIAEMVAKRPDRFRGLGLAPLQQPELAARYLKRIRSEFGFSGIEIGSNINSVPLGDARFDPVYAEADALGLSFFVHALHPLATKAIAADQTFTAMAGFPLDTGMAIASLVLAAVPERFPNLRWGFSHGGGTIGSMLGRLDKGYALTRAYGGKLSRTPSEIARGLFYDSNVYDGDYLRHLARHTAPGHVFLGTDYPYALMQTDPFAYLSQCGLNDTELESVCVDAAAAFLG
ncbi:MAG TPA: amidohydrolase family protein [Rhizomicrobium sp.]|jgi:aminocarboxymuconate-semialdehyde decarboxylase